MGTLALCLVAALVLLAIFVLFVKLTGWQPEP